MYMQSCIGWIRKLNFFSKYSQNIEYNSRGKRRKVSREVVGWAMDKTMTHQLVLKALKKVVSRKIPLPGLIHHSDQGKQYAICQL
jgi:transposase InsO family protein